jgi:hypothetical protein
MHTKPIHNTLERELAFIGTCSVYMYDDVTYVYDDVTYVFIDVHWRLLVLVQ